MTRDEYGIDFRVLIRLNVNCQSKVPQGWTIALKLHNERIDGVDWETRFSAVDGSTGRGWHRHQWNQRTCSAKYGKIPAPDFDGIDGREPFLIRALSIMRIKVNKRDYGDQLPSSCGSISQGIPLRSTNTMPVRQARSCKRGLPPFGPCGAIGSIGWIRFHKASGSKGVLMNVQANT